MHPKLDLTLFRTTLWGMGLTYYFRGESKKVAKVGNTLLDYGERQSDPRFMTEGHTIVGIGKLIEGDTPSAIECFQRAIKISIDPFVSYSVMLFLGMSFLSEGKSHEAENILEEVKRFSAEFGVETMGTPSKFLFGLVLAANGNLSKGVGICKEALRLVIKSKSRYRYAAGECMLGKIYLQIVQREGPKSLSFLNKNIGFLLKNIPFAKKNAEHHFLKAIEIAKEIGAQSILGQAYFDLGLLYKLKERNDKAKECISEAIKVFEECKAEGFIKQAREALSAL